MADSKEKGQAKGIEKILYEPHSNFEDQQASENEVENYFKKVSSSSDKLDKESLDELEKLVEENNISYEDLKALREKYGVYPELKEKQNSKLYLSDIN